MYSYPLYRPPSEAYSLIIQITEGCSYNKCKFCSMYKDKAFRIKTDKEIINHFEELMEYYKILPKRIFLADGDFMCLKTEKIIDVLSKIKEYFPSVERISSYCSTIDLMKKSQEELNLIKSQGLDMLYIGIESGSDKVLSYMNKGSTSYQMVEATKMAKNAGFILSCMIISGLGGEIYFNEHAIESARVISEINPEYFGLLKLTVEKNTVLYDEVMDGKFILLEPNKIIEENIIMLKNLKLNNCIFRANHISNLVVLKGVLNNDRDRLINKLYSYLN